MSRDTEASAFLNQVNRNNYFLKKFAAVIRNGSRREYNTFQMTADYASEEIVPGRG
jgi:hypothetical protein